MNIKEFRKYWEKTCREEIKLWENTEEHDLDFDISYKDVAYYNYKTLLEHLSKLK
jgi:hypothetical protein